MWCRCVKHIFNLFRLCINYFYAPPGHLSRELVPYVKSVVGVDISQRMVDEYNRRSLNQGIEPEEMRAIQADILLSSTSSELQEMKGTYDVVVVSRYINIYNKFPRLILGQVCCCLPPF